MKAVGWDTLVGGVRLLLKPRLRDKGEVDGSST